MLDFIVLIAGGTLAFLAFPNEVLLNGGPFLGPVVLVPVFWFTARNRLGLSALGGILWFSCLTLTSQWWLLSFHPAALPLVLLCTAPWYALAFVVSSLLWRRFPRSALWFQALWWAVFEFVRLLGFFSYPYSALASSVWSWPVVFQSADLVGTTGITFLLAWSSAWLASLLVGTVPWVRLRLDLAAGLVLWSGNCGYGLWRLSEPETGRLWRPALVQQAQDPWSAGSSSYEAALDRLEALSTKALVGQPDAVIWSETAFVPSVEYHSRYHENPSSLRLVRRLETFLRAQSVPFLVGNDHREKTSDGSVVDYNAALAWQGAWTGRYEKNRLVPFTESFPYRTWLPGVYDWLTSLDTHFWEPGRGRPVLSLGAVKAGTPICFEDSFADSGRSFAQAGAQVLVNLTNDSWAQGQASRYQHLSLAIFRAVETRLPLVRASNDGATASISRKGELTALLPVGVPGVLQAEVRLGNRGLTLYSKWGDWLAWAFSAVLGVSLVLRKRKLSVVDKGDEL